MKNEMNTFCKRHEKQKSKRNTQHVATIVIGIGDKKNTNKGEKNQLCMSSLCTICFGHTI